MLGIIIITGSICIMLDWIDGGVELVHDRAAGSRTVVFYSHVVPWNQPSSQQKGP